jgi:hypothetical protein
VWRNQHQLLSDVLMPNVGFPKRRRRAVDSARPFHASLSMKFPRERILTVEGDSSRTVKTPPDHADALVLAVTQTLSASA